MRRHAKAATAGSIKRRAGGLGRIFRGALAGRGACSDANGSGAPSHDRRPLVVLAALTLCLLVALTASVASGAVSTEFVKSFGPDGTEATDFERITGLAMDEGNGNVYVLDRTAGALYKFAADGTPLPWGGTAPYIDGNKIDGLTVELTSQVAVDSTSHVVYVTEENSLRAFQVDGEPAEFTAGPGAGTSEIPGFSALSGVAVDANGSVYASNTAGAGSTVTVYASTGEVLTSFEPGTASENLTVGPDGAVFVVNGTVPFLGGGLYEFIPSEFPVTTATTYTAGKFIENSATFTRSVDVDSVTGDLYILYFDSYVRKYDSSGAFVGDFGKPGEPGELPTQSRGLAVVPDGEEFQFYVGANGESTSKVSVFGEVIEPGPPSVLSTSVTNVTSTSAVLRAEVNPNTFATTYRFEYGLEDCATSACTSMPLAGAGIGSGHHPVKVSRLIAGLQPGTLYHYRVVAENSEGVSEGPDRILTTQVSGLGFELADRRAWEMVSPPDKHGGDLVLKSGGIVQAAPGGGAIAHVSLGSIEADPEGNRSPEFSSVLSRRGVDGWSSKDLTPPYEEPAEVTGQGTAHRLFSADLSRSLLEARDDTPLSSQASERTPYLRESTEPSVFTPLVTGKEGFANVPPGTEFGGGFGAISPRGTNAALTAVVFRSQAPLVAGAPGNALYRWSGGQIHPVSELPGEAGWVSGSSLGSDQGSVYNAVSADGLRVFWGTGTYNASGIGLTALYLRDGLAEETARLDVPQPGASGAGEARPAFQGASADGTVVFFTDSRDLTEDSSPEGRDLYRCEVPAGTGSAGCASLVSLSAAGPGESAMAKDLAPAFSQDGSHIYFVAEAVLDSEPNEEGDEGLAGAPNLYLAEEGEDVRFVATLSPEDRSNWGADPTRKNGYSGRLSAAASPSGRYLAFMSERSLTGYDNRDATSGEPTEQAFRYDAQSGDLTCVSCNPTGARPGGELLSSGPKVDRQGLWQGRWAAATLPEATVLAQEPTFYRPRYVLDDGRVFFNAVDALVPADSNGEWDVYQYEPTGVGDCSASSGNASTSRSDGGCVSLLSTGSDEHEAAFLDASASGADVFFLTRARLSVTDGDGAYDVYDARVGGVPATIEPRSECLGEACQPAAETPNDPTPASASFRGQGNQQARKASRRRCARGKRAVTRKGKSRCVPRQRKQKRNSHRAGNGRRVAR